MQRGTFSSVLFILGGVILAVSAFKESGVSRKVAYSADPPLSAGASHPLGIPSSTDVTGAVDGAHLPITQPKVLWTVSSDRPMQTSITMCDPAIADGILYYGDNNGRVVALRTADRTTLWTHQHFARITATPTVDSEFVYFGSLKGITAIRRDNGEQVWNRPLECGAGDCTPLPIDDRVFVSAANGVAYCLSRKDGETIWESEFLSGALSAKEIEGSGADIALLPDTKARPMGSASNGSLFLQSVYDQGRVVAFDCETGERRWTLQGKGWIGPAPTIYEDRAYIVSELDHLYCVELRTGRIVWKFAPKNWFGTSRVAVYREKVYLPGNLDAEIYEVDADNGKLLRTFVFPDVADRSDSFHTFPLIANDAIYLGTQLGLLVAFDLRSGEMLWKFRPREGNTLNSIPQTDGTRIYIRVRPLQGMNDKPVIAAIGLEQK